MEQVITGNGMSSFKRTISFVTSLILTTFEERIISVFRKQNDRIDILSFLVGSPVIEIGLNVV